MSVSSRSSAAVASLADRGGYAFGFMNVETDRSRYVDEEDGDVSVPRLNYTVLRVKRDVFAQSSVGAVFLNRQGGVNSAFNRAAGIDLNLTFGSNTTMTALAAKSFSPGIKKQDFAGAFDFSWRNDRFNSGFTYLDVGANFNDEMGYIRRTDIRNPKMRAAWTPRPKWRGVRQLTIGGTVEAFQNHARRMESRNQGGDFNVSFQDSSNLHLGVDRDYDFLDEPWDAFNTTIPIGGYTWTTTRLNYSSNQSLPLSGSAGVEIGGYYGGHKTTYRSGLNVQPLDTLLIEMDYNRNTVTLPGLAAYVTNTMSTRVSYSFSPTLFAKSFVQYNDADKLASLNLLLWYIYRPGSDLYVVYNQGWNTNLPGPHFMRRRERSLSVKLTYWLSR